MDDIRHRLAVEMVKTAAVIATRAVLPPRDSPHERCPAGRAVPCRAVRCHAVIPVVTCGEGVVTQILSVQGRILSPLPPWWTSTTDRSDRLS